jgi:hypothetical protein
MADMVEAGPGGRCPGLEMTSTSRTIDRLTPNWPPGGASASGPSRKAGEAK